MQSVLNSHCSPLPAHLPQTTTMVTTKSMLPSTYKLLRGLLGPALSCGHYSGTLQRRAFLSGLHEHMTHVGRAYYLQLKFSSIRTR